MSTDTNTPTATVQCEMCGSVVGNDFMKVCRGCSLAEQYKAAVTDFERLGLLLKLVEWLTNSFECYTLANGKDVKPFDQWDDYDLCIGPAWRQAVAIIKHSKTK